ncbi:MAG TPA: hypothetical protein EYN08_06450 [Gammaproteobacteria bacterium]|nr:hypothetical protein [Gammaproteobacteria bacterium]
MQIDRIDFLQELKLRELIREGIKISSIRKKEILLKEQEEEVQLRNIIKDLIVEATATDDNDPAPHSSTGINVLSDLLKKILPVIEMDFKKLTSDKGQRDSYRAHIVKAIEKTLAPSKVLAKAGDMDVDAIQEQETLDISVDDNPSNLTSHEKDAFIDINGDLEPEEPEEEDPRKQFGIEGAEETGRNVAFDTFKKVSTNIVDSYDVLGSEEDKDMFYDYLITNMKLYFDKFETDLSTVEEPTTDEYEAEVSNSANQQAS